MQGQVHRAVEGILETADSSGPDAVEEWEVDELLDWTTSLNFDSYFQFWKAVGTSDVTEMDAIVRTKSNKSYKVGVPSYDPYGISLKPTNYEAERPEMMTSSRGPELSPDLSPSPER